MNTDKYGNLYSHICVYLCSSVVASAALWFFISTAIVALLFTTAQSQLKSDHGWLWQNPMPQGNTLYSINFASDNLTGFAVGDDRTILRTEDGGFTWQNQFSPLDATLSAVFVRGINSAVIVGTRGTILTTD